MCRLRLFVFSIVETVNLYILNPDFIERSMLLAGSHIGFSTDRRSLCIITAVKRPFEEESSYGQQFFRG